MPLDLPCNASVSLGSVIVKACAYRPQDRYRTATEFKNALINEWNVLVQSGDNREIMSDAMRFGGNIDDKLRNTTNDMTANGHLVLDEYAQGTRLLEAQDSAHVQQAQYNINNVWQNSGDANMGYSNARSSKFCRMLSYPMNLAVGVLAVILFIQNGTVFYGYSATARIAMLILAVCALIADRNKYAVGIAVSALSLSYIASGLEQFLLEIYDGETITFLASGLLMFFGGIAIVTQREVRLGGTVCLCAVAIEWIYNIYQLINGSFYMTVWRIFVCIAAVTVFVWSYGYDSRDKAAGVRKILHIVTGVLSGAAGILCIARDIMLMQIFW